MNDNEARQFAENLTNKNLDYGVFDRDEIEPLARAYLALEARDKVLTSIMANLPDTIVMGENTSFVGAENKDSRRYYAPDYLKEATAGIDLFFVKIAPNARQ